MISHERKPVVAFCFPFKWYFSLKFWSSIELRQFHESYSVVFSCISLHIISVGSEFVKGSEMQFWFCDKQSQIQFFLNGFLILKKCKMSILEGNSWNSGFGGLDPIDMQGAMENGWNIPPASSFLVYQRARNISNGWNLKYHRNWKGKVIFHPPPLKSPTPWKSIPY